MLEPEFKTKLKDGTTVLIQTVDPCDKQEKWGHDYRDVGGRIMSGTVIESTDFANIRNNWALTLLF